MPDATLKDFGELATAVHMGDDPILPRPNWGQDAAYLAFLIDGMRARLKTQHEALKQIRANANVARRRAEEADKGFSSQWLNVEHILDRMDIPAEAAR